MKYFILPSQCSIEVNWTNIHSGNKYWFQVDHNNPNYEILMVINGPIYLQSGDEKLTLKTGDVYILEPWETHRGWKEHNEDASYFWIQFSTSPGLKPIDSTKINLQHYTVHSANQFLRTRNKQEYKYSDSLIIPKHFSPMRRFELLRHFENLRLNFLKSEGYYRFRMMIELSNILELLADEALEQFSIERKPTSSFHLYRFLVNWLDDSYAVPFSKERMEDISGKNYQHLCQVFKKYSNTTISTYINELRIQKALHLLQTTTKKISDIAYEVGFQDPLYFSKVFKKITGNPPSAYREQ